MKKKPVAGLAAQRKSGKRICSPIPFEKEDYDLIEKEAARQRVPVSQFIRNAAIAAAKKGLKK